MLSIRTLRSAALAAAVVTLGACGADTEPRASTSQTPVVVEVSRVGSGTAAVLQPARVVARQEAEVATRLAGTIASVQVDAGDLVRAGTTLATLDDADLRARTQAARAQTELARRTFQRVENLARDGAASPQELDEARARLAAADGAVSDAEAQAAYATIRAPFDGTVTARFMDPGDLAAPGMPLLRLASDEVKVVADLPAERARGLAEGDEVGVELQGRSAPGRVLRVVRAMDPASRRVRVEIEVEGEALPGSLARVRLPASELDAGARWLPVDAVVTSGQLTGVYAVERDTLRLRWVRLGQRSGDAVELLSGPAGDMVVVRSPASDLRDGAPVSQATPILFDGGGEALPETRTSGSPAGPGATSGAGR